MKKILLLICTVLFLLGIALNIQYAANDYDIKKNTIHTFILADDGTGTGTGTGQGGTGSSNATQCLILQKLEEGKKEDPQDYDCYNGSEREGRIINCVKGTSKDECNAKKCISPTADNPNCHEFPIR